jgi:hypothetical protein
LNEIAPPRQLNRYVASLAKNKINQREACRSRTARGSHSVVQLRVASSPRLRVLAGDEQTEARYNLGRHNKSLDASGVSGLLIHNLSVAQSSAAASTPPFDGFAFSFQTRRQRI